MKHQSNLAIFKIKTKRISSILSPIALGIALTAGAFLVLLALPAAGTNAQGPDEANVVVQFDDSDVIVRHINFTAPISGLKALQMTGLNIGTYNFGWGIAICNIEGVGCPATAADCFCSANFWGYNYWDGSAWQGYLVGAADSVINDGAVEGWRWGAWGASALPAPPITAASAALEWLAAQQSTSDGGYGGNSSTVGSILAIGANKLKAAEWRRQANSPSLLHYVLANGAVYANTGAGESGKLAVALAAASGCWPVGALKPTDYYSPTTGAFASQSINQSWAMLGVRALSQTVPVTAAQYLKDMAQPNGGWEFAPGWGTDTNSTALAIQALVAAGEPVTSSAIVSGLAYLKSTQNITDGGFPYDPNSGWPGAEDSDTDSTAYVVQAILAAGQDPLTDTWKVASSDPISYLLSMQLPDGSFEWQKGYGANLKATQDTIPALLNGPFPTKVADLDGCEAIYMPVIFRNKN
jgi:hypothetical protein